MAYANIRFENDGPLGILTLNRPNRRNALSLEMMLEVIECLNRVGGDSTVRGIGRSMPQSSTLTMVHTTMRAPPGSLSGGRSTIAE